MSFTIKPILKSSVIFCSLIVSFMSTTSVREYLFLYLIVNGISVFVSLITKSALLPPCPDIFKFKIQLILSFMFFKLSIFPSYISV